MSEQANPRVSIGLPVYNGDNFVGKAIESLLSQTFEDFELIISDNASTDTTEEICRAFVVRDKRIRYSRNAENIGLTGNYNQVFTLSSGEYFKWADHDDMCQPAFLMRCMDALDANPDVVLAYSRALTIDANGRPIKEWAPRSKLTSPRAEVRFRQALMPEEPFPLCGLIRAQVLRKTHLLGKHPESDIVLLAELSLHGPFVEIPKALFLLREHPQRTVRTHDWRNPHTMLTWMDPTQKPVSLPEWGLLAKLASAVQRAPLSWPTRWRCYHQVYRWLKLRKGAFLRDLAIAGQSIPGLGIVIQSVYWRCKKAVWNRQLSQAAKDVALLMPPGDSFVLVDDAKFRAEVFGDRRPIPFLEREGQYWGVPSNDQTAIQELERLRRAGATFIVFGWPAFWWLDHYEQFRGYLDHNFRRVFENSRVVIFDLGSEREQEWRSSAQSRCRQTAGTQTRPGTS